MLKYQPRGLVHRKNARLGVEKQGVQFSRPRLYNELMKIGFFELRAGEKEYLENNLELTDSIFSNEILTPQSVTSHPELEAISTHSNSKITSEVINSLPNLKLIITRTTGVDHIDLKSAQEKGVTVCNIPSYGENTVAEYAFTLLLALSRKIILSYRRIHTDNKFSTEGLQGFDLSGKTLGVIGTGKIGLHAIKIAKGFDMHILAYDIYPKNELQEEMGFKYVDLDTLLEQSDIISLHVPYIPSTHYLINSDSIKKMKKGIIIINTSRGKVVDTKALLKGLTDGHIAGAGLDVFEEEDKVNSDKTIPQDLLIYKIAQMNNVIVTPHNAFNTKEAEERILITTIENIKSFIANSPKNVVKLT